jgi:hypothetical protein
MSERNIVSQLYLLFLAMGNPAPLVLSPVANCLPFYGVKHDIAEAGTKLELNLKRAKVRKAEGKLSLIARVGLSTQKQEASPEQATSPIDHRHEIKWGINGFGGLHEVILARAYDKVILLIAVFKPIKLFCFHAATLPEPSRAICLNIGSSLNDFMHSAKPQINARAFRIREIASTKTSNKVFLLNTSNNFVDADN